MKKCLIVITGDNFRLGPQRSPNKGGEESVKRQIIASRSHTFFASKVLKKLNIQTEFFFNVYSINKEYDDLFFNLYGDYKTYINIHRSRLKNEHELIYDTIKRINNKKFLIYKYFNNFEITKYEFILFIRPDIYLKRYFGNIFKLEKKVKYAHIDPAYKFKGWNAYGDKSGGSEDDIIPNVNHIITYCHMNYFDLLLKNKVWHWHDSAKILSKYINKNNIGFFINSFHSCCSSLDWNPIYALVGRFEETKTEFPNLTYDMNSSKIIKKDKNIYADKLHIDTYTAQL